MRARRLRRADHDDDGRVRGDRAESTHFAVVPEHEQPEIEVVIERHPTYFVVEKSQEDAQEVARETDPRA